MDFTYKEYINLINLLKRKNYQFTNYNNYKKTNKSVIFRHDIDNSLEKALEIAKLENENDVKSIFFVLLSTDFYNIFSKKSNALLRGIMNYGHKIGLHFDEKRYVIANKEELEQYVEYERNILESVIETSLDAVSMHRPSKWILENDIQFETIVNSYSKEFYNQFKYLSDSRMYWREDILTIIESEQYDKLHILTHPFWYSNKNEKIETKLFDFINVSRLNTFRNLKDNFRDLEEYIDENTLNGVDFNAR